MIDSSRNIDMSKVVPIQSASKCKNQRARVLSWPDSYWPRVERLTRHVALLNNKVGRMEARGCYAFIKKPLAHMIMGNDLKGLFSVMNESVLMMSGQTRDDIDVMLLPWDKKAFQWPLCSEPPPAQRRHLFAKHN